MTRRNVQTHLRRQRLQLHLPQSNPVTVASSSVGTNQQFLGLGINTLSHAQPSAPNTGNRKTRRVMITPAPGWPLRGKRTQGLLIQSRGISSFP
jgi:hypothetical protein